MMTLDEMKLAVCEKLPELVLIVPADENGSEWFRWKHKPAYEVDWPTEGLQVCHEAEKLLGKDPHKYHIELCDSCRPEGTTPDSIDDLLNAIRATYEQRLEALCRVWFPERFAHDGIGT